MKALVIEGPHQVTIKEVGYPEPGNGEVTIRVERTGICGTDIHKQDEGKDRLTGT